MEPSAAAAVLFVLGLVPFVVGVFHILDNGLTRIGGLIGGVGAIFIAPALIKLWLVVLVG